MPLNYIALTWLLLAIDYLAGLVLAATGLFLAAERTCVHYKYIYVCLYYLTTGSEKRKAVISYKLQVPGIQPYSHAIVVLPLIKAKIKKPYC